MRIHDFAANGDIDGVRGELDAGVPVDERDDENHTPLARAAASPDAGVKMIRFLVDAGGRCQCPYRRAGAG